ncbi:unnamed protein product [Durusdinium trenchii]
MSLSSYEQHKLVDKVMIKLYELQEFWQWWGQCSRASWHAAIAAAEETPPMIMASAAAEANREHSNRSSSTRCSLLRVRRPGAGARPGAASVASRRQVASGSAGPCGAHAAQVRHRVAGALLAEMFQV